MTDDQYYLVLDFYREYKNIIDEEYIRKPRIFYDYMSNFDRTIEFLEINPMDSIENMERAIKKKRIEFL